MKETQCWAVQALSECPEADLGDCNNGTIILESDLLIPKRGSTKCHCLGLELQVGPHRHSILPPPQPLV